MEDLEGKVALVTGASSGLGRVFCEELLRHGCHVVAAARRTHLLHSLTPPAHSPAGRDPPRLFPLSLDVTSSEASIDYAIQLAWDAFGRLDLLINNAGFRGSIKSPLELDEEEWKKVLVTDLTGVWLVSKAVGKRFAAANIKGSIINISSIAALERGHLPGASAYAASKAGVIQLTKVMALELGQHKIRVNSIAPGLFLSEITSGLLSQDWGMSSWWMEGSQLKD
ncbi:hypothetical protein GOP47_0004775 [Adiantum capillus-veneris]|uniref:Uncharacterized protein n=1 Tax=Adiantum capillus-veneris TaxID=13818 RepID=A0A9D4V4N3_ADICA|nr:hypothetical protein GOP47_0004775 [Adiantum capillus-veneris]